MNDGDCKAGSWYYAISPDGRFCVCQDFDTDLFILNKAFKSPKKSRNQEGDLKDKKWVFWLHIPMLLGDTDPYDTSMGISAQRYCIFLVASQVGRDTANDGPGRSCTVMVMTLFGRALWIL